jgi:F-type H+-transporting ATPase subunit b
MKRYWFSAGLLLSPAAFAAEGGMKLISFSTLLGQLIALTIFIWFSMKYVWPALMKVIETRQQEIADGLAAGEQGKRELSEANTQRESILQKAREQGSHLVSDGEQRKAAIIDSARQEAEAEKARIIEEGRKTLDTERVAMRREMESKLGGLIIAGASQILQREVDDKAHQDIVDTLKKEF